MITITWERLVEDEDVPGTDQLGESARALTSAGLNFAGWISILAAATSLPLLIFEIAVSTLSKDAHTLQTALKAFDAVLGVYLCVALRRLLHGGFRFHPADTAVAWWTGFGAFFCTVSLWLPSWSGKPVGLTALIVGVSAAILLDIAFGIILLRLKDDPYDCLNAYAFSHIASGVCIILTTML